MNPIQTRHIGRIRKHISDLCRIEQPSEIVKWVSDSIVLTARHGSRFTGPYNPNLTPYVLDVLRSIDDPKIRRIVLMFGAQTGKTQIMLAALARWWFCSPGPTMIVQPNESDVGVFGETRVKPMLEDSPILAKLVPEGRKDAYQKLTYRLPGSLVYLIGAGSPSKMASKPIRYVVMDEVDKYPRDFTSEGSPLELIVQRTKTYSGQEKILISSTPTTPDGLVYTEYLRGDCREFFCDCPSCHSPIRLTWDNVSFVESESIADSAESAGIKCKSCGAIYRDQDKPKLVAQGYWKPTRRADDRATVSYHLQSLCAPWVALSSLVNKFLTAKDKPTALRAFVNSELAEVWRESDEIVHPGQLLSREADYAEGESFPGIDEPETRMRIAGVDVQRDELVLVIREFALGGASGLVLKRRVPSFADLAKVLMQYGSHFCLVDSQFRTTEVLAACASYPESYIHPAYGRRPMAGAGLVTVKQTPIPGTAQTVEQYGYDQSHFFGLVVDGIRGEHNAPPWWIYRGASDDVKYTEELCAKTYTGGYWHADSATADHYGDAEKLAMVGAFIWGYLTSVSAPIQEPEQNKVDS